MTQSGRTPQCTSASLLPRLSLRQLLSCQSFMQLLDKLLSWASVGFMGESNCASAQEFWRMRILLKEGMGQEAFSKLRF